MDCLIVQMLIPNAAFILAHQLHALMDLGNMAKLSAILIVFVILHVVLFAHLSRITYWDNGGKRVSS